MFRQDIAEMKRFDLGSKTWGSSACAISCVFDLIEQLECKFYSPRKVRCIAMDLLDLKAIDDEFYVSWKETFKYFGLDVDVAFEDADYICKENEYEFLMLKKPGFVHFVRGDGKGNYSWDSLGIREAQKGYEVTEKRIIKVKGSL